MRRASTSRTPDHPIAAGLGNSFSLVEEFYQFRDFSRDRVRVLMTLDPRSIDLRAPGVNRTDEDFALAWVRDYGQGRVFYTALGHFDDTWTDPRFRRMLREAFLWLTRLTPGGDATPRGTVAHWRSKRPEAAQGGHPNAIAPGAWISIGGTGLTSGATMTAAALTTMRLAGTTVRLNGAPLPISYASPSQINVYVPLDATIGDAPRLTVTAGVAASELSVHRADAVPGIFAVTSPPGAFVLWAGGLGAAAETQVRVNGQRAVVFYSGLAPGWTGLYQVNVPRPEGIAAGEATFELDVAGATARRTVRVE